MLTCVPFAWVWMTPSQFKDFSEAIVAVTLFSSNILFWLQTDYFAPLADAESSAAHLESGGRGTILRVLSAPDDLPVAFRSG
ncbi:hypothetical protein CNY89_20075, partial [Amaricoccus sp. HAR-UPW-R2A-40]